MYFEDPHPIQLGWRLAFHQKDEDIFVRGKVADSRKNKVGRKKCIEMQRSGLKICPCPHNFRSQLVYANSSCSQLWHVTLQFHLMITYDHIGSLSAYLQYERG